MKSMEPSLMDIFFMTFFYRAGGPWPPRPPLAPILSFIMNMIVNVNRSVNHPQLTLLIILQKNSNQCEPYQKISKS